MANEKTKKRFEENVSGGVVTAPSPAYLRLVKQFRLRPLHSEEDHRQATVLIDNLHSRRKPLHSDGRRIPRRLA